MMRHPKASALNAVFSTDLPSTRIVLPSSNVGRLVGCPSSSIVSAIVQSSHPPDALPPSSREPSVAASMFWPAPILARSNSKPSLSGGKSNNKRLKFRCCIGLSGTTRCIHNAFTVFIYHIRGGDCRPAAQARHSPRATMLMYGYERSTIYCARFHI